MPFIVLVRSWWARLINKWQGATGKPQGKRRKKRKPRNSNGSYKTLSALLEDIDVVQERLLCKTVYSEVSKRTRKALIKLGPYIPYETAKIHSCRVEEPKKLSALMFVSFSKKDNANHKARFKDGLGLVDVCPQEFGYAVKAPKRLPPGISKPRHRSIAVYECGAAIREPKIEKMVWTSFYVSVDGDGEVEVLRRKMARRVSLPRKAGRRGHNGGSYTREVWDYSSLEDGDLMEVFDTVEQYLKFEFCGVANFWAHKDKQWSVSVRRKGYRATFSVPMKETKYYFKGRERTALTRTGKIKTIIHHVREHQRDIGDRIITVREHLRGMREFIWHDCLCCVTAPRFHLFNTQAFTSVPDYIPDGSDESYIEINHVAKWIAGLEDHQDADLARDYINRKAKPPQRQAA